MSLNLAALDASRLLFAVPLRPLQGQRFQPTGFPNLGAATYQTPSGTSLLVESVQSMANRLEATIWDSATDGPIGAALGLSHVTVRRKGKFLTDTMLESHRINSPYLLEGKDKKFFKRLQEEERDFHMRERKEKSKLQKELEHLQRQLMEVESSKK